MRAKIQFLNDSKYIMDNLPRDSEFMLRHEALTLEVLVDIRDLLEQRLASLDNTILKYIIPK